MTDKNDETRDHGILPEPHPGEPTVTGLEGNYRIIRLLGRGTMASVYLAEQLSMARPVALKILTPSLSKDPSFVDRFLGEARASARLNHPNIVSAIDFGEADNRFFLAMEYVDGVALSVILERDGPQPEKKVLDIGLKVISALAHAAENNVIHLDIKPANIVICDDGRVKLADFGLAMILDKPVQAEMSRKAVGTPYYMSPEQVEGRDLDWRSDQFSLGASLYEAVTGHKAFPGELISDVLIRRFFDKPPPAWKVGRVSRGFSTVLEKMLSRSPDGRYQSIVDLEADFNRILAGKPPVIAKISIASDPVASTGTAWSLLGYDGVVDRVDGMMWRKRWNWIIYASLLFLLLLVGYASMHARELMGPATPRVVAEDMLSEARNLPPDIMGPVREMWEGAMSLVVRAEKEPTADNLRRAIYSMRLLANNRNFKQTAYSTSAKKWVDRLEGRLRRMDADKPEVGFILSTP